MKDYKAYLTKENREGFKNLFANYAEEEAELSAKDIDAIILSEAAYALADAETAEGRKVFNRDVHDRIREMLMEGISGEDLFPLLVLMLDGNDAEISFKDGTGVEGEVSVGARSFRPNASPKSFTVLVPIFDDDGYGDYGDDDYEDDDLYDEEEDEEDPSAIQDADEDEEYEADEIDPKVFKQFEEYDPDEDEDEDYEYDDDSYI
ncbi:MAG: hypothetical protein LUE27_11650 [Clostridia bacterium]|nr:hypothetical protein [Clostridia bacterium]